MTSTVTADMVRTIIADHDANRPRSQQTRIGPSEIGGACPRRIGYQITHTPPVNQRGLQLAPWIGTAAHDAMTAALAGHPDWLAELQISLPGTEDLSGDGHPITGTLDAYHLPSRTIVDWKFVADTTIQKARAEDHPGPGYQTQVQLYALGLAAAGTPVDHVAVAYIPRSGRQHNVHVWTEPANPGIAEAALERLRHIRTITDAGLVATLPTGRQFCESCPWYLPAVTSFDDCCPGHTETRHQHPAGGTDHPHTGDGTNPNTGSNQP